ncbi:hypothetical protein E0Z10_g8209 [Xylaria hypoxylon]|uniref:Uncharacterized protein n=1 Tax=Xylaria hypoxylon TaxID=37992 RepID=A0A4Z0YPY3_9PEZI|nr:hypothetical protein E0Z10_g8209 [Xylaria hypoxylon]
MSGSYVPPFRRRDAPQAESSSDQSHQSTHHDNRGARGGRQGRRGSGRGGRGRPQRDFFNKQNPQVDQSDLYHEGDIHNYFWSSEDDARGSHSSTFRNSKDRPGELSHMLLFFGANPRWASDRIIFAKSKLTLLPEYAAKKAENGEWETEKKTHESTGEATKSVEDGAAEKQDAMVVPDEAGTEAVTQASGATFAEAQILSCPSAKKQNSGTDKSSVENDTTTSIDALDSVNKDNECQIKQEHTQDGRQIPTQGSIMGVQESGSPTKPSDDKRDDFTSEESTNDGKQEEQHASVEVEGIADHEGQATPIFISTSTMTASRLKYTDIRKEEAQLTPVPNQSTAAGSHMKHTDIRTIPANEFYRPSEPESTFPAIAPIDYVPANPLPIAIFEEQWIPGFRSGGTRARFAFKGWFKISRVNILAPHSAELVRMLQQKWERKNRFGHVVPSRTRDTYAWNESLGREWAVIRFELLEGEGMPPPPQIEKLPEPKRPVDETKNVNEMLSDMRLDDGNTGGGKEIESVGGCDGIDQDIANPEGARAKTPEL